MIHFNGNVVLASQSPRRQELIKLIRYSFLNRRSIVNASGTFFNKSYVVFKAIVSLIMTIITVVFGNGFATEQHYYLIAAAFDGYCFGAVLIRY